MNIYEKLLAIQSELKAPKGQYNSFGKYKYRSCEDILEAVKPICKKYNAVLTLSDEMIVLGDGVSQSQTIKDSGIEQETHTVIKGQRYYIKATASLIDTEDTKGNGIAVIENIAYAREDETKKGMDGSQITGTASSYARKYALNGLFCIDDTKDADTDEYQKQQQEKDEKKLIGSKEKSILTKTCQKYNITDDEFYLIISSFGYNNIDEIQMKDYASIGNKLSEASK